jgi:hypothetical protein
MEKKIIGFKLIKHYPGCPVPINYKGTFISSAQNKLHGSATWNGCGSMATTEELLKWTEFWQPIYEEEKVINLNEIIENNGPYTASIGIDSLQAKKLMRNVAEETINFVIDYLNDPRNRQGQSDKVWREDLKKRIR